MQRADLPEVLVIEAQAHPVPWTEGIFAEELERDWARLVVLKSAGGAVLGYSNYWLVHDEVHLLNIAVHQVHRSQGYGRQLLEHVLEFAIEHQCRFVTLEVRKSNEPALALYLRHGFTSVGVRPAYYADNKEDAIVMVRDFQAGEGPESQQGSESNGSES